MANPEQAQETTLARLEMALMRIAERAEQQPREALPAVPPAAMPLDPVLHEIAAELDAMIARLRHVLAAENG